MFKHIGFVGFFIAALLTPPAIAQTAPGPLVDDAWVKANSCADNVLVIDIRNRLGNGSKQDYLDAHIPCAVYSDYLKDGWRKEVSCRPATAGCRFGTAYWRFGHQQ